MKFLKREIDKKSQTTIFIVLAIVILAIVLGSTIFIKTRAKEDTDKKIFSNQELNTKLKVLERSFFNCLDTITKESIEEITKQGGYYKEPDYYHKFDNSFVPYYHINNNIVPNDQLVETELSKYVDQNLISCLENVNKDIFRINYDSPKTIVKIDNTIIFNTDLSIEINHEEQIVTLELNEHQVEQKTTLIKKLNIAQSIVEQYNQDNHTICFTCISDEANEKDLYVGIYSFDESSLIIRILDDPNDLLPLEFLIKLEAHENEI